MSPGTDNGPLKQNPHPVPGEDVQVDSDTYSLPSYDDQDRFIAYWNQTRVVRDLEPSNLLEIGKGNGFFSDYISSRGISSITLDFDPELKPTVTGSILKIPFRNNSFDVVAAFEVLEHIPYVNFRSALQEMKRVAKKYVVISLPDASRVFRVNIDIYGIYNKWLTLPFPKYLRVGEHKFDGQHYWEIGKIGYHIEVINKDIESCGLHIVKNYRPERAPFCHFFVLSKTE